VKQEVVIPVKTGIQCLDFFPGFPLEFIPMEMRTGMTMRVVQTQKSLNLDGTYSEIEIGLIHRQNGKIRELPWKEKYH